MARHRRLLTALGVAAGLAVVLTATAQRAADEEELYARGRKSFREKSYRPAVTAFEELLERFPKSARAREVRFLVGESCRIAQRFGRESTYPQAEKAYKALVESEADDLWRARAHGGLARLYSVWNYWQRRQAIDDHFGHAETGFEKQVKAASAQALRRELGDLYVAHVETGLRMWGYQANWQELAAQMDKRAAEGEKIHENEKLRVAFYKKADELLGKLDALKAGEDLEARARWALGQRSGSTKHLEEIIESYAATEWWDDATFRLAQMKEGQGKFLEAIALYEKLTARFNEQQSRYVKQARHQVGEIRKPRISVGTQYAALPGTKPKIAYSWRNQTKADFKVFRCEPFGHPHHMNLLEMARAGRGAELKAWSRELENKGEHQHRNAEEELDLPEAGAYLVTADAGGVHADTLVLVTRLALITKSAHDRTKVYVADALSGEPLAAADVQMSWHYRQNRQHVWHDAKGATNDGGFFAQPQPGERRYGQYFVLARKDGSYAFASSHRSYWSPMQPGLWFYGYTDRPAYRPEEEVHFKFIVRHYDGDAYRNVAGKPYRVRIHDSRGGKIYEKDLTTSENGTLADSLKLGKEPKLGAYRIFIRQPDNQGNTGQAYFRVEEYKLPEYKVDISTAKPTYRVGDQVDLKIAASYYFGGPVPEAECEVIVRQREYWHFYHPPHPYSWYYDDIYRRRWGWRYSQRGGGSIVKRATLKTDEHGVATLTVDTPKLPDDPAQRRDYVYSVEARVVDKSRREIQASKDVKVTVQPFYVYVNPKSHVYLPGDRVEIDIVARNANDTPVKTEGMVRVYRAVYNEEKEKQLRKEGKPYEPRELYDLTELQAEKLATDAEGKAHLAFTPDQPGYLLLEATALTEKEEKVVGSGWAWVASKTERYLGYRLSGVEVIPNKQTYKKGETAQVLLVSHFPNAHVWLGVEGDHIYDDQLVLVRERSKLITIPIKDEYSPNVFVTANLVRDAMIWRHQTEIVVPPEDHFLNVEITTAKKTYRPGETAHFEITATDHKGRPAQCELSLGLVDSSVYYIQPEYAQDIRKFFYGRKRGLAVRTDSSFSWIRHKRDGEADEQLQQAEQLAGQRRGRQSFGEGAPPPGAPMATRALAGAPMEKAAAAANGIGADRNAIRYKGGGAGGGEALKPPEIREDFRATAYWQPAVRTDSEGKALCSVKFPDSLTEWTATARAVTPETAVGNVTFTTQTKKNIIVRLQAPRFFQERDQVTLSAIVHNYLEKAKEVRVTLKPSGLHLSQKPVVDITVPSGGEKRVDWVVDVRNAGEAKVTVMAQTDEESDAMVKTYDVLPHGVEKLLARSGTVGEPVVATGGDPAKSPPTKTEATETLTLPAERNRLATVLNIDLSPSIASTMLDSLEYLAQYPYGCVEQTMSRFLPAVVTAKTLRDLGVRNAKLEAKLPDMVSKGLDRIYQFQRGDGGWSWWHGGNVDPWMTAYVVYGLTVAKEAGIGVDDGRLQRGVAALRGNLVHLENRHDTMAYALYVLSNHKIREDKWLGRIWDGREKLNAYSRALTALTYHHLGDGNRARVLLRNLEDFLEEDRDNRTAHWGKTAGYWRWSDDAVEATSYALKAYLAIDPNNRLVKPVMKWLVFNRRGNRWKSTRDTAKAVYALADYVRISRELAPNYTATVFVNGKQVGQLAVTKDNALSLDGRITLGDADLKPGPNTIRIVKEGTGNLYYATGMYFYTKEERIQGAGNEIFVKRSYTKVALDKANKEVRTPLAYGAKLASGDRIEVTLDIEAKNNYEYLVFEDPKPSGCEAVELRSGYRWRGGLGAYMEIRDEKTAFFVSYLRQGKHKITYTLRAEIPGTFNALPTSGYAMYIPDIRTISDEMRLLIGERAQLPIRLLDAALVHAQ